MLRLMLDVNLGPALWLTRRWRRTCDSRGQVPSSTWPHGGVQREQGRSCPPDTHSGYRTAPAWDPGECGRAAAARHSRNRAMFPAEVMAHAVAPEAIAGVIAFLVSDAAAPVSEAILPA